MQVYYMLLLIKEMIILFKQKFVKVLEKGKNNKNLKIYKEFAYNEEKNLSIIFT